MEGNLILWQRGDSPSLPTQINTVGQLVDYASTNLTPRQQEKIVNAFNASYFDMAAQYAWDRAINKLRKALLSLGLDFIAEILQRSDIKDTSAPEDVLTDRKAIEIAEQLGVINKTAALKLRQAQELIAHYRSDEAVGEMEGDDSYRIIKDSVHFILSEQDADVAIVFKQFREKVLSETLSLQDSFVVQILTAPLFYLRTVCTVLLNAIKNDKSTRQEHALTNINILLPEMWKNLAESDRYHIGEAYRDVSASGDSVATKGLKIALSKVKGFDYVPETLRSNTFRDQAKKVIEVHYQYNNFYNEVPAVRTLSKLGSIIPKPAFKECVAAYLVVYLGNGYGYSHEAAPIAEQELMKISADRWEYYFSYILQHDEDVLSHLFHSDRVSRFAVLIKRMGLTNLNVSGKDQALIYRKLLEGKIYDVVGIAQRMYAALDTK